MNNTFKDLVELHTDRLTLRKLKISDREAIFDFTSMPEVCEYLSWHAHESIEVTENFIKFVIDKYSNNEPAQWCIELKTESKAIGIAGYISFLEAHRKGELAYILSPKYQGQGFMTEALDAILEYSFTELKLNRIEAKCEIDNFASEKVMQKINMTLEGCFKSYLIRNDIARDYKFYSLLSNEFKDRSSKT